MKTSIHQPLTAVLRLPVLFLLPLLLVPFSSQASEGESAEPALKQVLLYDRTVSNSYVGLRINLRKMLTRMSEKQGFALTTTRNESAINYSNLKTYDVVIFAYSDGDVVASTRGQADLERYVRAGGGFLAVNAKAGAIRKFAFLKGAMGVEKIGDGPNVRTQFIDKGRVVSCELDPRTFHSPKKGQGPDLLWNLMTYAATDNADEGLAKMTAPNATTGVVLEDRSLALSLGEGIYSLKVFDSQGKTLLSKAFTGPGQFRTAPIPGNGSVTATLTGPSVRIRKQFTLK